MCRLRGALSRMRAKAAASMRPSTVDSAAVAFAERGWPSMGDISPKKSPGPSRVTEWTKDIDADAISEADFIARIGISSTKAYVTSILKRYRAIPAKTAK